MLSEPWAALSRGDGLPVALARSLTGARPAIIDPFGQLRLTRKSRVPNALGGTGL